MISMETSLKVADNTGAQRVKCFRIIGQRKRYGYIGDLIRVSVLEARPGGMVKKGEVRLAVIVRTSYPLRRADGSTLRFDNNAVVLVDDKMNPLGSRIFGPIPRELRDTPFAKIISLAPEAL